MATVKEVLIQARELIADPERWTTGDLAVDADGTSVNWDSPDACKWCALGAVMAIEDKLELVGTPACSLLDGCALPLMMETDPDTGPSRPVVNVNDLRGHATVLQVFDCAIAKAS